MADWAPHCCLLHPEERPFWPRLEGWRREFCPDGSSRENALLTMRERSRGLVLDDELERSAVPLDVTGVEMSADHERRAIGKAREQFAPRHGRLSGIGIGGR